MQKYPDSLTDEYFWHDYLGKQASIPSYRKVSSKRNPSTN